MISLTCMYTRDDYIYTTYIDTCPTIVLQPVTPINDEVKEPDDEMISYFKGYIKKEISGEVVILGQIHKCLGIR